MSTKALHLELVSDLTTNAFLAALRRFVSRRGRPTQVYSHNGTNFVGVSKELKRFLSSLKSSEEVCAYTASEGIIWNFNPPHSPHFCGLWEAGIKSVKTHLKKIIGMTPLTFEEMYTILTQVEACLNSRPLCALSNYIESPAVLTPGHFLIGQAPCALPNDRFEDIPENRLTRWELLQRAQQVFWHKWSKDYLHQLQQRSKWKGEGSWTPRIGDLVIVKEDNLLPLVWKVGVEELFPGDDAIISSHGYNTIG
jgi:hypothetical protein